MKISTVIKDTDWVLYRETDNDVRSYRSGAAFKTKQEALDFREFLRKPDMYIPVSGRELRIILKLNKV